MSAPKRPALGRGLGSLMPMDDTPARGTTAINEIPLSQITRNPDQPRTLFDEDALEELTQSVREFGIIQPVSLRTLPSGGYQIIAGERRFRAAQRAGLTTIPAYIREADDSSLTEMALIENIQREDLNPIEIALTYKKLLDDGPMTQERLSERIGKKRSTIANSLRLLHLPSEVQLGLCSRAIDMGHARALLSVPDATAQLRIYKLAVKEGLSVRAVELLAKKACEEQDRAKEGEEKKKTSCNKDYDILRKHLSQRFSTPVKLSISPSGRGRISFDFSSDDELQRLIAIFDTAKQ